MHIFKLAAETESAGGFAGLATALGLNLQALILNTLAFFVIVWILGKFVFPSLIKALDAKRDELDAAARMEREAKASLDTAEAKADDVVQAARQSAEEILATAKADATAQIEAARAKAAAQSERAVTEAREQLARDVTAARRELKTETARLVAEATAAVLNEKLDGERDRALIGRSLETK
jgi:F-type H+-transporting ATPase subunit b